MPTVKILGVYRPVISEEIYQEQLESLGSDEETKDHFDGLVLVEALASSAVAPLPLGDLGQQPAESDDPNRFLCAYDEALLSSNGEEVIEREMDCVHGTGELRFAFYLHYFDPARPIRFMGVDLETPSITDAPERLLDIVPYNPHS